MPEDRKPSIDMDQVYEGLSALNALQSLLCNGNGEDMHFVRPGDLHTLLRIIQLYIEDAME